MSEAKVFSIDHGNRFIKSENHHFPASFVESDYLPSIGSDTLIYEGNEYTLDDQQVPQKNDKTKDESYFILTLFAIGKEIITDMDILADATPEGIINVKLLAGLPPLHCKEMGPKYKEYFTKGNSIISFEINKVPITIKIVDVYVYPQAYAAALTAHEKVEDSRIINVIDIGGYTVDCLQLTDFRVNLSKCTSLYNGVNVLFQKINEQVKAKMAREIPYIVIEGILQSDEKIVNSRSEERIQIVRANAERFTRDILSKVSNAGFDLEENPTIFVGGGSMLLSEYIKNSAMVTKPIIVDNIRANVDGYQMMYSAQNQAHQEAPGA